VKKLTKTLKIRKINLACPIVPKPKKLEKKIFFLYDPILGHSTLGYLLSNIVSCKRHVFSLISELACSA